MKKRTAHRHSGGTSSPAIRLEFTHLTAAKVCVAGTFNDWRPAATHMVPVGGGRWLKELLLPPGIYEYRIVVDDEWMADPLAAETVPNSFGGLNSVLKVDGPQPSRLAAAPCRRQGFDSTI